MLLVGQSAWANPLLINLPADSWFRAPKTSLAAITPPAKYLSEKGIHCVTGPSAIVTGWSGGAYDPIRHKMFVWGGGHTNYCGNELYAFDVNSLTWERYTEPSLPPYDRDPLADGNPVSRHTYDGLQFLTHADRFWAYGGSRSVDGGGTSLTWVFDASQKRWINRQPSGPAVPGAGHIYNLSSIYDPVSRKVFMRDPHHLYTYDYDRNTWTRLRDWAHSWNGQRGVLDSKRRLYFTIGSGELQVYDIAANQDVTAQWQTTGGSDVIALEGPGVDYDAKADTLVAFKGGGIQALDCKTKAWTAKSGTGAPPRLSENGTYGRWRYIAEYNVFILVNSIEEDVYFYKHTAGGGSASKP